MHNADIRVRGRHGKNLLARIGAGNHLVFIFAHEGSFFVEISNYWPLQHLHERKTVHACGETRIVLEIGIILHDKSPGVDRPFNR